MNHADVAWLQISVYRSADGGLQRSLRAHSDTIDCVAAVGTHVSEWMPSLHMGNCNCSGCITLTSCKASPSSNMCIVATVTRVDPDYDVQRCELSELH